MRQPPSDGPRAVEWTATMREEAGAPAAADEQLLVLEGLQVAVDAPRA